PPSLAMASAAPTAAAPVDNAAYLSGFPDARSVTPVTMASASTTTSTSPPSDPIFRSLFQVGGQSQPVSPTVRELWGSSSSLTSVPPAASVASATPAQAPNVRAPQPLDLFS